MRKQIEKAASKITIPKEMTKDLQEMMRLLMDEADRQEREFLFPFLKDNARPKIKGDITLERLLRRDIKRCYNPDTMECWYEQDGEMITPVFIRDPRAIAKACE